MNTVSQDKATTRAVMKFTGLLMLAALAIAFFALPMASLAMCVKNKPVAAKFVALVTSAPTMQDGTVTQFTSVAGTVLQGSWIIVSFPPKGQTKDAWWAATITSKIKSDGTATGTTTAGTLLKISGIPQTAQVVNSSLSSAPGSNGNWLQGGSPTP